MLLDAELPWLEEIVLQDASGRGAALAGEDRPPGAPRVGGRPPRAPRRGSAWAEVQGTKEKLLGS
jgi:hypothetical protein